MKKTTFVLLRHGETEWNLQGRRQGQLDSPLTALGKLQALAAGRYLAARPAFDGVYSSDLRRASQTAQLVLGEEAGKLVLEPGLRERHLGVLQGLTVEEAGERHPEAIEAYNAPDPATPIEGGESLLEATDRAMACLKALAERHEGGRVLVVTHGGLLTVIFKRVVGVPLGVRRRFHAPNASIHRIGVAQDGRFELLSWCGTEHLEGLNQHVLDVPL